MALQKITNQEIEEKQIASLPDRMTGTAAENKAAFDALTKAVIEKYNELINVLSSLGGAAEIGSEPFAGVGEAATVRAQLIALQENIAGAVAGSIPDASITTEKLVDQAITTRKLAANAVTATEIANAEVTKEKIRDLAISTIKLADGAVTEAKLADGAVTEAKIGTTLFKAYTGTYTGTGTKGESNKTKITFPFTPKFVHVLPNESSSFGSLANGSLPLVYGMTKAPSLDVKWGENNVSFWATGNTATAATQYNTSGTAYHWVAIG